MLSLNSLMHSYTITTVLFTVLFGFVFSNHGISQTVTPSTVPLQADDNTSRIVGTVKSDAIDDVVVLANVFLYSTKDSTLIKGMVTNEKGQYAFNDLEPGNYTISVECVGHQQKEIKGIQVEKKCKKLNEILLSLTDDVRSKVSTEPNSIDQLIQEGNTFSVYKNIAKKGEQIEQILRKIPAVTVDQNGEISIEGCSKVLLLLNGIPTKDANIAYIPTTLAPKHIKRIEVCTNSSAKQLSTDVASIINIIIKKTGQKNSTLAARLDLGTNNQIDAFIDYSYTIKKFLISTSYSFNHGKIEQMDYFKRSSFLPDTLRQTNQYNTSKFKYNNHYFTRTIGFKPNAKNTFSGSLIYSFKFLNTDAQLQSDFLSNNVFSSESRRTELSKQSRRGVGLDFSYLKTFDHQDQYLSFYASYSLASEKDEQDYEDAFYDDQQVQLFQEVENSFAKAVNNNWYFKLDYVHPLRKNKKISINLRSNLRKIDNEFSFNEYCFNLSDWQLDEQISNELVFKDQDHFGRFLFSDVLKRFSYTIGFNAQQVFSNSMIATSDQLFEHNFLKIFPTIKTGFTINKQQQILFQFNQSANRPLYNYLNPFNNFDNPLVISMGNPALQSEFQTTSDLSYKLSWAKGIINSSFFHHYIDNVIAPIYFQEDEVLIQKWENLTAQNTYGFKIKGTVTATKFWKIATIASVAQTEIDGKNLDPDLTNKGSIASTTLEQTFLFPKFLNIQLDGFYQSKQITAQGTRDAIYFMNIGLSRSIFKGKGELSFKVTDVFNTRQLKMNIADDGFDYTQRSKWTSRFAHLGITYALNHKTTPSFKDPAFGHSIFVIENTPLNTNAK